ncbi:YvcK family protein [Candidatus Daviesbacteria bacterium]|nr:YvcK family protein [Candidatus Daviesbacteria bacterium]
MTEFRIVTFGGGTGHYTLLRGLVEQNRPESVTAVPSTWDDGGSSGRLRTEMGVLPQGDARQCLLALMTSDEQRQVAQQLFNDRFASERGPLKGHSLGNLIFARLERTFQGQDRGLEAARILFKVKSKIIPPTLTNTILIAKTKKGVIIEGETNVDHRKKREDFDPKDRISRLYFDTKADANPQALHEISKADVLIFSSGDLYTSILPHLLISGIQEGILSSKAKLFFIVNLMTKAGETDFYKASDHIEVFLHYLGDPKRLNYIVVNENRIDKKVINQYREESQELVKIDAERIHKLAAKSRILKAPMALYFPKEHLLRHNPEVLASTILKAA